MHQIIYFDDRPLYLCDEIDEIVEPLIHHDDTVFIDELNTYTIKTIIHEMQLEKVKAGVFFHPSLSELYKAFKKKFTLIMAGGGLVQNEKNEVLLIFRRGKWDLPKGKLDKGESIEDCAIREVQEETGLLNISLEGPLMTTYHTYHEGSRYILKESHWYGMKAMGDEKLIPQTEEDILEIKWVKPRDLKQYYSESFPSVVDVLKRVAT
ncbi:MAG: Diadenosine hexaphosphate hydrolase [Bacteroidetes bacterium ADurb.BinA245]|jgi:8-oxo-dGTP pyrophosphatase MutT (NUDIX family)|nr:MAG: Diadenosine hexaphosphate hydrolase [Bacteroidetes bacterium ADurb.BinA245]HNO55742.1 NUDIX domain-containing protein [Chitinophagaceae bacterium]